MGMLHFSHIALSCQDPFASERFYVRHFGFRRARVIPDGSSQVVFLKHDNVYLELFQATEQASVAPSSGAGPAYPGYRHIAFQVENVDAWLSEIGNEATITLGPLNFDAAIPGWRTVWLADPDGNVVRRLGLPADGS